MREYAENIGAFLFLFCVFCFIWIFYGATCNRNTESCEEYCKPYKVLACSPQEIHFWHPKYVNVLVVCDGVESKKVDYIVKD